MEVAKQIEKDLEEAKEEALNDMQFLQEEPEEPEEPRDRFLENES